MGIIEEDDFLPVSDEEVGGGCIGEINSVDGNTVAGWLASTDGAKIEIDVRINGIRIASRIKADTFRSDLQDAGMGDGEYGFVVGIPWRYSFGDTRHIEIIECSTGRVLLERVVADQESFVGYFESVDSQHIGGWLVKWGVDEPVRFDIKVNGTLVATDVVSNRYRADLEEAGIGSGQHAFDAYFPQRIHKDTHWLIELVDKEKGFTALSAEGYFENADSQPEISVSNSVRHALDSKSTELDTISLEDGTDVDILLGQGGRHLVIISEGATQSIQVWRDGSLFETLDFDASPITVSATHMDMAEAEQIAAPLESAPIRRECYCLLGDGESVKISLRQDGEVVFEDKLETQPGLMGRLERYKDGALYGWAVDFHSRNPTKLELYVGGILHSTHTARRDRQDISERFGDHLVAGFEIQLNGEQFDETTLVVSIRIAGSDYELPSKVGPITSKKVLKPDRQVWGGDRFRLEERHPVTVVVPIYNAPTEVEACIESLLQTIPLHDESFQILLLDDASPDPLVARILDRYEGLKGVTVIRHATNLGYTGNINAGIGIAGNHDVVLLNSDTEVTDRWLEKLQQAAYRLPSIGTVTAVSDNAGAFSVPSRNEKNVEPAWLDRASYARLIANASKFVHPVVPTGSGFCLYIKRSLMEDVGVFDALNFARGYGEENEFCMRAQNAGWMNVIAENVLIYHERSASFQDSKSELMALAGEKVPELYPEYPVAVGMAFGSNPLMTQMRFDIRRDALRATHRPSKRILFVIGVESGGTPQTNMDLMSSIQDEFEPFLLLCSTIKLQLFEIRGNQRMMLEDIVLTDPVTAILHDSRSYAVNVAHLLQAYDIDLIHIRHIGRHGLSLVSTAKSLDIPVIFSLHDFYTICPNIKLLDGNGRHCGGRCTEGREIDCTVELWEPRSVPPLKHKWIRSWQTRFGDLLKECDVLITTSPAARALVCGVYGLDGTPFEVIPHGRSFEEFSDPVTVMPKASAPLKVLAPGHMVPSKGLDLIAEIKKLDHDGLIEFHFLGTSSAPLEDYGIVHGKYQREDFAKHVESIRPDVGFVVSIWPETYSHTLTELWSCGIPVVTSPLGAVGERMEKHGGGWILETLTPQHGLNLLLEIRKDRKKISEKQTSVQSWQAGYGQAYNIDVMARQYVSIYRRTLARRIQPDAVLPRVYCVSLNSRRDRIQSMPLEHLDAGMNALLGKGIRDVATMPNGWFAIPDELPVPQLLVIQFDGAVDVDPALIESWIETHASTPFIFNILSPFASATQNGRHAPILDLLVAKAALVVVTGEARGQDEAAGERMSEPESTHAIADQTASPPALTLPSARTIWTADHNNMRLDAEMGGGLSQWIGPHNRTYVDANFELINWNGLLASAKARQQGRVSIVIPVFNDFNLTRRLIETIEATINGDVEIIVVDNGSKLDYAHRLANLPKVYSRVKLVATGANLMFAVGCNVGASYSTGEYVLFLNNDMEAFAPKWLDTLIAPLKTDPTIGIVGGKLLYPDNTIQHAGIAFGSASRFPYHIYKGQPGGFARTNKSRRFRAVTGACMAMRTSDWIKLRGFNPVFVNGSEDVDLCLRMKKILQRNVMYVHDCQLVHYESKTPGRGRWNLKNREIFVSVWRDELTADDYRYYKDDAVTLSGYTTSDGLLEQSIRAITPIISF